MERERDGVLNIRLPQDIKDRAQRAAEADNRSLSGFVVNLLDTWLTEHGFPKPTGKGGKR